MTMELATDLQANQWDGTERRTVDQGVPVPYDERRAGRGSLAIVSNDVLDLDSTFPESQDTALATVTHLFPEQGATEAAAIPKDSYIYDETRFSRLEAQLVEQIRDQAPSEHRFVAVAVPWDSPYAGIGHMSETQAYGDYDNHAAMQRYENRSLWIFTVDTENAVVEHIKRIVKPLDAEAHDETGLTGIEVIDDRLTATDPNEVTDLEAIKAAHGIRNIRNSLNITSNHITGRGADSTSMESGLNTLRSYKATFFMAVHELGADLEGLFAYLNMPAVKSLGRMGLESSSLAGGEFHLPDPDLEGGYDHHYTAVFIPNTPANRDVFTVPFVYEPAPGEAKDRKLVLRAMVSSFIANEIVPVLALKDNSEQTTIERLN